MITNVDPNKSWTNIACPLPACLPAAKQLTRQPLFTPCPQHVIFQSQDNNERITSQSPSNCTHDWPVAWFWRRGRPRWSGGVCAPSWSTWRSSGTRWPRGAAAAPPGRRAFRAPLSPSDPPWATCRTVRRPCEQRARLWCSWCAAAAAAPDPWPTRRAALWSCVAAWRRCRRRQRQPPPPPGRCRCWAAASRLCWTSPPCRTYFVSQQTPRAGRRAIKHLTRSFGSMAVGELWRARAVEKGTCHSHSVGRGKRPRVHMLKGVDDAAGRGKYHTRPVQSMCWGKVWRIRWMDGSCMCASAKDVGETGAVAKWAFVPLT